MKWKVKNRNNDSVRRLMGVWNGVHLPLLGYLPPVLAQYPARWVRCFVVIADAQAGRAIELVHRERYPYSSGIRRRPHAFQKRGFFALIAVNVVPPVNADERCRSTSQMITSATTEARTGWFMMATP